MAVLGKIGRGRAKDAPVLDDAAGKQVGLARPANADIDVDPFRKDIDRPVQRIQPHLNLRITRREVR